MAEEGEPRPGPRNPRTELALVKGNGPDGNAALTGIEGHVLSGVPENARLSGHIGLANGEEGLRVRVPEGRQELHGVGRHVRSGGGASLRPARGPDRPPPPGAGGSQGSDPVKPHGDGRFATYGAGVMVASLRR